ncbi:hypothetical protein BAJUN_01410 [Bajunvirus bajun]|uniref:Uncharacterized protein n=1 Tax=Brevundimonas phage vB_BgoS-Bajun TaxID=2948594 RepID=A0A9E7N4J3_9CAUD|nr:hypothetical protein BAJUN_01410 [Brevundimonas phage vB_BgoS-Bajun]
MRALKPLQEGRTFEEYRAIKQKSWDAYACYLPFRADIDDWTPGEPLLFLAARPMMHYRMLPLKSGKWRFGFRRRSDRDRFVTLYKARGAKPS